MKQKYMIRVFGALGIICAVVAFFALAYWTMPADNILQAETINTVVPKFFEGDMVRTKVGGYVGQVILIKIEGGDFSGSYEIRFTSPCGGFLFDAVSMKEFEVEKVEMITGKE